MDPVDPNPAYRISTLTAEFVSRGTEEAYQHEKWRERSAQNRLIAVIWFCAVCLVGLFNLGLRDKDLLLWETLFIFANLGSVLGIILLSSLREYPPFYDAALWLDAVAVLGVLALAVVRGEPNSPFWISTFIAIPLILNVAFAIRTYYSWGATAACLGAFHAVVRAQEFEPEFSGLLMLQLSLSAGVGVVMHWMINSSQRREYARWVAEKDWGLQLERAKIEAERANRSKSAFLSSMSHELRTPLNGVLGLSALLKKTDLDGRQEGYVRGIGDSAKQLLELFDELLDLSKIEAGKLLLKQEIFAPLEAARESITMVEWFAVEKGLELKHNLGSSPWEDLHIRGDRLRFRQVLINLLMNAIKFTSRGEARLRLEIQEREAGNVLLRMEVCDSGVGISQAEQEHLFERFYQGENGSATRGAGWGLGLAITKELVEAMRGTIQVTSAPGEGSRFAVEIPAVRERSPSSRAKPRHLAKDRLRNLKALFAEDNRINALIGMDMLKVMGMGTVDFAENGRRAAEEASSRSYDIIFMDLAMPEMDGFEAARILRSQTGPNQKTPILAMTAYADAEHRERSRDAGMSGFLTKPFSEEELGQKLLDCLPQLAAENAEPDSRDRSKAVREQAVAMALEDFPMYLSRMEKAWEAGKGQDVRQAAHALKGAAAVLAAEEVRAEAAAFSAPDWDFPKVRGKEGMSRLKEAVERWMRHMRDSG